jgi:hypothetical protein
VFVSIRHEGEAGKENGTPRGSKSFSSDRPLDPVEVSHETNLVHHALETGLPRLANRI